MPELELPKKLKVFVSSKNRLRDDRAAAEEAIREIHMEPILVEMDRWIAATERQEWLAQLRVADLVVLLLEEGLRAGDEGGEEDPYRFVQQEIELAAKLGTPLLLFLRAAEAGAPLNPIAEQMYQHAFGRRYQTASELERSLKASLLSEVFGDYRRRSRPLPNRRSFYEEAAMLVRKAQHRVYLGADTPVVFFGPRQRLGFENDFFEGMMDFIRSLRLPSGENRECVIFFNEASVRRELAVIRGHYNPKLIGENLRLLDEVWSAGGRLQLLPTPGPHTFALFDDDYVMWIRSGALWSGVTDCSPAVSDHLQRLVHQMGEAALNPTAAGDAATTDATYWRRLFDDALTPGDSG